MLIIEKPVGAHSLHPDRERQVTRILHVFTHDISEEISIDVAATMRRCRDDLIIFGSLDLERLLVDHLSRIERTLTEVFLESLI
jgi:hypothetical protein